MLSGPILLSSYARCGQERSFAFAHPVGEVVAAAADEVRSVLSAVERAVGQGLHAAGFVCYEAAAGLDPVFTTHSASALPLVYFGLFEERTPVAAPSSGLGTYELDEWRPSVSREEYEDAIERIRAYIAAGDTYQVNYTLRLHSRFPRRSAGVIPRYGAGAGVRVVRILRLGPARADLGVARVVLPPARRALHGTAHEGNPAAGPLCS